MAHVRADEFLSATKYVLEPFPIDTFRETQQDANLNLSKGKDISQFPDHRRSHLWL